MRPEPLSPPSPPAGLTAKELLATMNTFAVAARRTLGEALLRRLVEISRPHLDPRQHHALNSVLLAFHGIALMDECFAADEMDEASEAKLFRVRQDTVEQLQHEVTLVTPETVAALVADLGLYLAAHRQAQASPGPTVH